MRLKLIMMLKNEDDLARPWIAYHAARVGAQNLIVLDNGSTSPTTLAALEYARSQGAQVNTSLATPKDFLTRSQLYTDLIKHLDQHNFADFWFPLDCDEFLATSTPHGLRLDRDSLEAELAPYLNSPHPLRIAEALNNHPLRPGCFRPSPQEKTFFAAGACDYLDHGFHHGRSVQNLLPLTTGIVYIHYHYKPFPTLVDHARAKLAGRINDFSREALLAYSAAQKPSFHLVNHLLITEEAYYRAFNDAEYHPYPEIAAAFAALGEKLPFS